mgnify:CR=1 FL=1
MQQKSVSIPHFLRKIIALLRKIKLQPRLLITFLAISLIPVVAIGLYAYQVYTDSVRSKVGEYAEQSAKLLNKNLQLELEKYGYYIDSLSVMDSVQSLFSSSEEHERQTTEQIHSIMQENRSKALAGPYLREIQIISLDSELLYSWGFESARRTTSFFLISTAFLPTTAFNTPPAALPLTTWFSGGKYIVPQQRSSRWDIFSCTSTHGC